MSNQKFFVFEISVRDERTARYLNEADDRSHFKDSPLREETRQIRIHPEDRRRFVLFSSCKLLTFFL